jgi:hypothetical protein
MDVDGSMFADVVQGGFATWRLGELNGSKVLTLGNLGPTLLTDAPDWCSFHGTRRQIKQDVTPVPSVSH